MAEGPATTAGTPPTVPDRDDDRDRVSSLRFVTVLVLLGIVALGVTRPVLGGSAVGPVSARGGSPPQALGWAVFAFAATLLAGLFGVLRFRRRRRGEDEQQHAVILPVSLLARLGGLLVALVVPAAMVLAVWLALRAGQGGQQLQSIDHGVGAVSAPSPPPAGTGSPVGVGPIVVLGGLASVVLAACAITPAVQRWRRRDLEPSGSPGESPPALAAAVAAGRQALAIPADDRQAVIACYVMIERSLAGRGVARTPEDTASEHLRRAVDNGLVESGAVGELLAVFHRARFSDHPIRPGDRQNAQRALASISARLQVPPRRAHQ